LGDHTFVFGRREFPGFGFDAVLGVQDDACSASDAAKTLWWRLCGGGGLNRRRRRRRRMGEKREWRWSSGRRYGYGVAGRAFVCAASFHVCFLFF